jgi:hypothetical protein
MLIFGALKLSVISFAVFAFYQAALLTRRHNLNLTKKLLDGGSSLAVLVLFGAFTTNIFTLIK